MSRIAEFLFEAGMLKRTPRSGWQFLGSGGESVADHVFRTAVIAFALSRVHKEVDTDRVIRMVLFHDLPEGRTGDLNYMNQKYVKADEKLATEDMTDGLPFGAEVRELVAEFRAQETEEAVLARDADQLDFIMELKTQLDGGNDEARDWLRFALQRLRTEVARQLADEVLKTESSSWWFDKRSDWWIKGGKV